MVILSEKRKLAVGAYEDSNSGADDSPLNEPVPNLDDLLAAMSAFAFGPVPLQPIASENSRTLAQIGSYDPLRLAADFSGLLTVPELQSNCVRLEALIHLTLAIANGKRKPNEKVIRRLYATVGAGMAGRLEDPSEDVFVSSIATPRGNFRILEGILGISRVLSSACCQCARTNTDGWRYDRIRANVYSILQLSDFLCERAGLVRNQLGNENSVEALPSRDAVSALPKRSYPRAAFRPIT